MLILFSTLVLIIIAVGVWFKRRPEIHIPVMCCAFAMDLGLLLYIEVTRHAVENLSESIQSAVPDLLLYFHVLVSVLTLILYGVQIITGIKLSKGRINARQLHLKSAYLFITCRLLNYITSFFVIQT
jgi:hypothetical protein